MTHTSILIPNEFSEDNQDLIDHIARKLAFGARRAMLKLTDEFQTAKEGVFSTSGARFLWWQYQDLGLSERKTIKKMSTRNREYDAFRLTPLGLEVKKSLIKQGII